MPLPTLLLTNVAVIAAMMLALWLLSVLRRDASVVDPFWGFGFAVVAWSSLLATGRNEPRTWLIVALVTIWGMRLSGYLLWRNWGKPEDYRYAEMREKHGNRFLWVSLITVFCLQGALMWVISLPVQLGILQAEGLQSPRVLIGAGVWCVGLLFEAVGDWQLARFKADPSNRGQVMDRGLWHYTRHPNYFGDFLIWWGLYLVAAEPQTWWWTIIGPVLMSFLLIRVSGVRLLESSLKSRISGYESYVRRTSAFFPLPPKRET